jgi:hypothetical protein
MLQPDRQLDIILNLPDSGIFSQDQSSVGKVYIEGEEGEAIDSPYTLPKITVSPKVSIPSTTSTTTSIIDFRDIDSIEKTIVKVTLMVLLAFLLFNILK